VKKGLKNGFSWTLINADAGKGVQSLSDNSVDCVVTSPPYYWQRDYGVSGQIGQEDTLEAYVRALTQVFTEVHRVLKKNGTAFLVLGDTYYSGKGQPQGWDPKHKARAISRIKYRAVDRPGFGLPKKSLIGIPWRVALSLQKEGWILRSVVTWKKPTPLAEPNARDRPWRGTESIFVLAKSGRHYFNRKGLEGDEDVWEIAAPSQNGWRHAAPFPEALALRCMACGCPKKGIVLDPFVGSGTTIAVANKTGRHGIGIDLNPKYIRLAVNRLQTGDSHNAQQTARKRAGTATKRTPRG
jgi:DNA modification methylase